MTMTNALASTTEIEASAERVAAIAEVPEEEKTWQPQLRSISTCFAFGSSSMDFNITPPVDAPSPLR